MIHPLGQCLATPQCRIEYQVPTHSSSCHLGHFAIVLRNHLDIVFSLIVVFLFLAAERKEWSIVSPSTSDASAKKADKINLGLMKQRSFGNDPRQLEQKDRLKKDREKEKGKDSGTDDERSTPKPRKMIRSMVFGKDRKPATQPKGLTKTPSLGIDDERDVPIGGEKVAGKPLSTKSSPNLKRERPLSMTLPDKADGEARETPFVRKVMAFDFSLGDDDDSGTDSDVDETPEEKNDKQEEKTDEKKNGDAEKQTDGVKAVAQTSNSPRTAEAKGNGEAHDISEKKGTFDKDDADDKSD